MLIKLRSKMQKANNQKGFTLVELMVVVVIIGILAAIAVPVYGNITKKANRSAVEANLRTIDGAILQYTAAEEVEITEGSTTIDWATIQNNIGTDYLQGWPTGPDGVNYKIVDGKATVNRGPGTGGWFTIGDESPLPIDWENVTSGGETKD